MHRADTIRTPTLLLVTTLLVVFGTVFAVLPAGAQEGATEQSSEGEAAPADPPRVTLETNRGTLVLELFPEEAPETVENFLAYAESGFYDGTVFHRVIPGFMIQGGGFTTDFQKKETRAPVENESDNGLSNTRGTVAMARTRDPHSATSQFFINVVDNASLDHSGPGTGYTVFGEVVEGMDVADAISKVPTSNRGRMADVPREAVVIEKVTVE